MASRRTNGSAVQGGRRAAPAGALRPSPVHSDPTAADIAALTEKGVDALRMLWAQRFRCPPPPMQSADVLRRLFAWRIQADAFGDLDAETTASMKRARSAIAKGKTPLPSNAASLRSGTILVREWRGVMHRVLVLDNGFEHEGKRYRSLSEAARTISGTHWSGPRFFGIEERTARATATAPVEGVNS